MAAFTLFRVEGLKQLPKLIMASTEDQMQNNMTITCKRGYVRTGIVSCKGLHNFHYSGPR